DRVDFALLAADRFDGVFHVLDQPALDRFGEFDLADTLRDFDQRAHRLDLVFPVLPSLARRHAARCFQQLLIELLVIGARSADIVDLLLDLLSALLDALVGDFLVVEDHELADRALAAVELIAQLDDALRDERRARNRLDDGELAAFDAPRDLDFAFASQK